MEKTDFYRNARKDIPGPLAGVRVLEVTKILASIGIDTQAQQALSAAGVIG